MLWATILPILLRGQLWFCVLHVENTLLLSTRHCFAVREWGWHACLCATIPPERSPKQRDDKSAKDERMSSRGPVILTWSRGSKWKQTCMTWQHILIFTDVQLWLLVTSAKATKHIVFWHVRGFCARVCVIIFAFAVFFCSQGKKNHRNLWRARDPPSEAEPPPVFAVLNHTEAVRIWCLKKKTLLA